MNSVTQADIRRIERELGIRLPQAFQDVLINGDDLRALTEVLGGVVYPVFMDSFYLEPQALVCVNILERNPEAATEFVFPGWWHEYVIIGSNGAGDYYCLRLDGTPDVWFLCNDTGEITREFDCLGDYVTMRLEQYRAEHADSSDDSQGESSA